MSFILICAIILKICRVSALGLEYETCKHISPIVQVEHQFVPVSTVVFRAGEKPVWVIVRVCCTGIAEWIDVISFNAILKLPKHYIMTMKERQDLCVCHSDWVSRQEKLGERDSGDTVTWCWGVFRVVSLVRARGDETEQLVPSVYCEVVYFWLAVHELLSVNVN